MIPLSVPNLAGNECKYIKDCLDTNWVSSVGSYVDRFEKSLVDYTGAKYAISTVNGTAALHIALMLSGVEQNDYVIVPNITFIASCNAVKYCGAEPILIDIDPETWQMDTNLLKSFLEEETIQKNKECLHKESGRRIKAIMPVHVLGNMIDMDALIDIASEYHLEIVEDATEALGSFFKGKHSGTFGKFGCFSFNGNKIITTGGGGIIVTDDPVLAKKAKHITTQAKADNLEYYHDEIGYNYRLVNLLAAMGVAQMELLPSFVQRKKELTALYKKKLQKIDGLKFQQVSSEVNPNEWLFTVYFPDKKTILDTLNKNSIQARPFWVPMNQLPMFKNCIYYNTNNISGNIYDHCVSLPCSTNIKDEEIDKVCDLILNI